MPEKTEKGDYLWFFNIHSVAKHQKIEGRSFGKFLFEKSLTMPKKLKGGPFSLSRYGMLRGKRGKTFLVQFARPNDSMTIKFCRTFKNYFGQLVLIEKSHYNSRVSLKTEAPTKNWLLNCEL